MPAQATEDQMLRWLWFHYRGQSWTALPQVTVAGRDLGSSAGPLVLTKAQFDRDRRIDMLVARKARNPDKHGPLETLALEVKVSRADFLSDVRDPSKQAPWRAAATKHAYVVPAGLVQEHEVPAESGLLWIDPPGPGQHPSAAGFRWVRRAPHVAGHKPALPFRVITTMLWRISTFEGQTRGWYEGESGSEVTADELRGQLTAVRAEVERVTRERDRALEQRDSFRQAYALAAPTGVPCSTCGNGLKPIRATGGWFKSWRHVDKTAVPDCLTLRARDLEAEARAAWDAADEPTRERQLRFGHHRGFQAAVEAEPWRTYLLIDSDSTYPTPHPGDDT